jgi:hypothetical protein
MKPKTTLRSLIKKSDEVVGLIDTYAEGLGDRAPDVEERRMLLAILTQIEEAYANLGEIYEEKQHA